MKQQTFSVALDALKEGKTVAREGWNGKGMYLLLVLGEYITNALNETYGDPARYKIKPIPVSDAIYIKTADDKLVPWLASQTDLLSEDWIIDPYKK